MLTLFVTPVFYLYMDSLQKKFRRRPAFQVESEGQAGSSE
jgi:hypothetical protein